MKDEPKKTAPAAGRSRPSAAYELQFRRELDKLIDDMRADMRRAIRGLKPRETAQDAITISATEILKEIRAKWYAVFEQRGRELSRWFADKTQKRTQTQMMKKLKSVAIKNPDYSFKERRLITLLVNDNVAYIKSIPQQYIKAVGKAIRRAFIKGGDWQEAYEEISEKLEPLTEDARHRASLITRDQANKITLFYLIRGASPLSIPRKGGLRPPF